MFLLCYDFVLQRLLILVESAKSLEINVNGNVINHVSQTDRVNVNYLH